MCVFRFVSWKYSLCYNSVMTCQWTAVDMKAFYTCISEYQRVDKVCSLGSKTSHSWDNTRPVWWRFCCNKSSALIFRVIVASWASREAFERGRSHHGALKGKVSHQLSNPKFANVWTLISYGESVCGPFDILLKNSYLEFEMGLFSFFCPDSYIAICKQIGNLLLNNRFLLHLHLFKNIAMFKYLFHLTEQILMFFLIGQDLKNDHWINFKGKQTLSTKKKKKRK